MGAIQQNYRYDKVRHKLTRSMSNADGEVLPVCLRDLNLSDNNLDGVLRLSDLPTSLESLDVSKNHFDKELVIKKLPPFLKEVNASDNQLNGIANLRDSHLKHTLSYQTTCFLDSSFQHSP